MSNLGKIAPWIWALALLADSAHAQTPSSEPGQGPSIVYGWLAPGTPLYSLDARSAEPVATVASLAFVPVFSRDESWAELMYLGERLRTATGFFTHTTYAGERTKAPVPREEAGLAARFFPGVAPRQMGPFFFVTDFPEGELLTLLGSAAYKVEEAYRERYGLEVGHRAGETFLVFSTEEAYKAFITAKPGLAIFDAATMAGQSTAALVIGQRSSWEVVSSFLHAATHLLNRRLFDRPMPPWLEEGLAEDLDCFWAEDPFAPAPGMMGARWNQGPVPVVGCYTPMIKVAQGQPPPELLATELLVGLDRRGYVEAGSFAKNQLSASWLVAYLLNGEGGALASGFRDFLAEVAQGQPATGERLLTKLGKSWGEIDSGYRAFGQGRVESYAALFAAGERWRAAFSGTGVRLVGAGEEEIDIVELTRRALALHGTSGASRRPYQEYPFVWFPPGSPLHEAPDGTATGSLSSLAYLPVLEEQQDWLAVQHLGQRHWLKRPLPDPPTTRVVWATPRPGREELGLAMRLFGKKEPTGALGPFKLYTDSTDSALLAELSVAAAQLEAAYERRFGIEIKSKATEAVLLFARREDFRALATTRPNLLISDPWGFSGVGSAILFIGEQTRWDLIETLVHELTHVLNRRRLNDPHPPPWIEEGLATDLGCVWTEDPNALVPGMVRQTGERGDWYSVASACAARLLQFKDQTQLQALPRVEQLVSASREQFYAANSLGGYTAAALLVRYFLDGEDGALAPGFKAFLNDIAREKAPTPKLLSKHLGRSWDELDTGYRLFVAEEAKRMGELLTKPSTHPPPG